MFQDFELYLDETGDAFTYSRFKEMIEEKGFSNAIIYLVSHAINKKIRMFSNFQVKHVKKILNIDPENRAMTRFIHIALDKIKNLTKSKSIMKLRKKGKKLSSYKKLHYIDLGRLWDSL